MLTILFLCDELACSIKVIRAFLAPISRANPHIILDVLIETESSLSGSIIGEIQSSIQRPKTFLDYRNELFSEKRGTIRNSMDLFLVVSSGEDYIQQEDCLNELDIIRSVEIADNEYAQSQIDDVLQRRGKAIFIDFAKISDIDFVLNILDMINRKNTDKRIVLFKDQVIQRTWDLKFDNKRIGQKIDKYELMIDRGLRIFSKHFDESDLIWEAVTKWNFWNFIALEIFYATRKIARFEELQT